jgi:hypothetical protein
MEDLTLATSMDCSFTAVERGKIDAHGCWKAIGVVVEVLVAPTFSVN